MTVSINPAYTVKAREGTAFTRAIHVPGLSSQVEFDVIDALALIAAARELGTMAYLEGGHDAE